MSPEIAHSEPTAEAEVRANLAYWQDQYARLDAEPGMAGSKQYPEWWHQEENTAFRDIEPQLQQENVASGLVSEYYNTLKMQQDVMAKMYGWEEPANALTQTVFNLGPEIVAEAMAVEPEDGPIRTALVENIGKDKARIQDELTVLKLSYGVKTTTELLGIGGDEFSDTVRAHLLTENGLDAMRKNDQEGYGKGEEFDKGQADGREWMDAALAAAAGISKDEASAYTFSASRKGHTTNILRVINQFNYFGPERINKLSQGANIYGLEGYSTEQLERMEAFIDDPVSLAEKLRNQDTTVMLINRVGDNTGAMANAAEQFDDDDDRTLFFEINTMDDIYRRMIDLRNAGVEPSTVIVSSHAKAGQFMITDHREKGVKRQDIATIAGRRLVAMDNVRTDSTMQGYSMHGMKGMARIVEDYMRPSRGINDDASDEGRKKIIVAACEMASEVDVRDNDADGEKIVVGSESVVSQLGKDLIASGIKSDLDIYGADYNMLVTKTKKGVRYDAEDPSILLGTTAKQAIRIRVEQGSLTKQKVDEIVLHK